MICRSCNTRKIILIALMFVTCFIWAATESDAAEGVTYLTNGVDDTQGTVKNYTELNYENVPNVTPAKLPGNDDGVWYVVKEDVTYNGRIDVTGKVNLILCDGATLTANNGIYVAGPNNGVLTVYAQSKKKDTMGKINATAHSEDLSGIGGNDDYMDCGTIYIFGGDITAQGGENAAGIGGGYKKAGGDIVISGGNVNATGGEDGAGIGGGEYADGGKILINGGNVTAKGGEDAAGIGGGDEGTGGEITIAGGKVKTDGGGRGAGIGGGCSANAGSITINGGDIDARGTGGEGVAVFGTDGSGAGIGGGCNNKGSKDKKEGGGNILINGGKIFAGGGTLHQNHSYKLGGAGIGTGSEGKNGCRIEIRGGTIEAVPGSSAAGIGGGCSSYGGTIIIGHSNNGPTITSSCQQAASPGYKYEYYCIGSSDSDEDSANISFDYPNSKVWINGQWSGYAEVNRTVNANERAGIVKCGSGTFNKIKISPCDHPNMQYEISDTGHIAKCRYCSLGENATEEDHVFGENNKCTKCGYEKQEEEPVAPHEHEWGEWETETEADCSHEGSEIRTCLTDPTHIERRTVPVNSERHASFGRKKENEKPATCTSYGESDTVVYCTACGETISITHNSIRPLGHDWGEWKTIKEAGESKSGLEERTCAHDPSHKETRIIPEKGHEHKLTKVDAVDASCTENGNHEHSVCSEGDSPCGRLFADEKGTQELTQDQVIIYAQGHKWGDEVKENETEATCEAPASYEAVIYCDVCSIELSRLKKTEGEALGHDWGPWKVTRKATAVKEGEKQRICRNDPTHVEKQSIPKTGVSGALITGMTSKGSKSLRISWTKVSGADGYDVFFARCNHGSTKPTCKLIRTVKGNKSFALTKSGLKKKTPYKAYVKAFAYQGGKKTYIKTSPLVHAYSSGVTKKYTNAKSVSVSKSAVSLSKGKTYQLHAKAKKLKKSKKLFPKKHVQTIRYLSSNSGVASVSGSGKITARSKGTCVVYAYAHNGVYKTVKVTVK